MIFSLQQRFLLLLVLPVTVILILMGTAGFFFSKDYLLRQSLKQWKEIGLVLEKAAHSVDMQLNEKLKLVDLIAKSENIPIDNITQAYLIQQLVQQEGVLLVDIETGKSAEAESFEHAPYRNEVDNSPVNRFEVTPIREESGLCVPSADSNAPDRSMRIVRSIGNERSGETRKLLVRVSFDSVMEPIKKMLNAEGSSAYLVTDTGQLLAHTDKSMSSRRILGETGDSLEKKILEGIRKKPFGTVLGDGHPPDYIAGFYKIPPGSSSRENRLFLRGSFLRTLIYQYALRVVPCP